MVTDDAYSDQDSGSETAYQDSLTSLTESMAAQLFTTSESGSRYSALSECYHPSFDEPMKRTERDVARFVFALAGSEKKLWWESEGSKGMIDEILGSGRILEPRVLDVGCGVAGVWISDVGSSYPRAEVIGVDVVPVERDLPPNATSEIWDVKEGLPFPDSYFNVVHIRLLLYWMPVEFNHLITVEVRRVLAPGGVLIIEESDANLHDDNGDNSKFPWRPFDNGRIIDTIVFDQLRSTLKECPEDPYDPSTGQLAFSSVEGVDWDVHLGWRDGKAGEGSSTRIGNHFACVLLREIYTTFSSNQRTPERKGGVPSNRERELNEIVKTLRSGQNGILVGFKTYLAVRS